MEKTTTMKGWMGWPVAAVAAAVLGLGGCGGGGGDTVAAAPSSSGSITACFTANSTVNFALTASNVPANSLVPNRSTTGPMIYNGQAVTGEIFFYPNGNTTYTQTAYWTATNSGVTLIAAVINAATTTVTTDGTVLPQNMSPGQTAINSTNQITTFVGFESVNLAGKIFANACHLKTTDTEGNSTEVWYAPGYGQIKGIFSSSGEIIQYNGDL